MRLFAWAALATAAVAAPRADLRKRQSCGPSFVFARGSTEPSPMGFIIGPPLQSGLRRHFPSIKTYPVLYEAALAPNVTPARTDDAAMAKGVEAFEQAYKACPSGIILAGGYSQGAAVMHNVIGAKLTEQIKGRIAGVALFGDTRNKQDGGHIPHFPPERSKVWCNANDGVCDGQLTVNAGHLSYSNTQMYAAADWLAGLAKGFK